MKPSYGHNVTLKLNKNDEGEFGESWKDEGRVANSAPE
jgi:hypothetical protein